MDEGEQHDLLPLHPDPLDLGEQWPARDLAPFATTLPLRRLAKPDDDRADLAHPGAEGVGGDPLRPDLGPPGSHSPCLPVRPE